jgi:hypothetical protein
MKINGSHLTDEQGRVLMLRGVNLGGSSKVPFKPDCATHLIENFYDHRNVSFTGRPFPPDEADIHFKRLSSWGFTFLRFIVTWEAIEHAGPGIYDEDYLDYLHEIISIADKYGISVYIDPHQDVWSRFTGGDGAPGWTLEAAGFEIRNFTESGAAVIHSKYGDPLPNFYWPTNGSKLAAATMFTLFFGGNDFAPWTKIDGMPVQEFLQTHYINAFKKAAEHLSDLPNIAGYGSMNEPYPGYIGWRDLTIEGGTLTLGDTPTPYQSMLLGDGYSQEASFWEMGFLGLKKTGKRLLNKSNLRAWQNGKNCIWKDNGVWNTGTYGNPELLKPDYFFRVNGREVNFSRDYLLPFIKKYSDEIRKIVPDALIFVETETGTCPSGWGNDYPSGIVYAPHWYDAFVMAKKNYLKHMAADFFTHKPVFFSGNIKRSYIKQLGKLKKDSERELGGAPVLLGEFGMPFDLKKNLFFKTGKFTKHEIIYNRSFSSIEANLLNCTLWNYTADNSLKHGDSWNSEDFSIYCPELRDNPDDINSGGRALRAAVRPYPAAVPGIPQKLSFDMHTGYFEFTFRHSDENSAPTLIFIPEIQYPDGFAVEISDGKYEIQSGKQQLLYMHTFNLNEHTIKIFRK